MNRAWMPGLTELRAYQRAWLSSDQLAGLSVAAIQVAIALPRGLFDAMPHRSGLADRIGAEHLFRRRLRLILDHHLP